MYQPQVKPVHSDADDELIDVLTAISIVSKRLAQKMNVLQMRDGRAEKGGDQDEQDE